MIGKKTISYDALLIDLDGTLIDLDTDNFTLSYIDDLSGKFVDFICRDDFVTHLFGSTAVMIENSDPAKKNETVFYEDFCRRIGYDRAQINNIIDDYYRHDFSSLSRWAKGHPYARALIESAKEKNLALILATNPVFPATAVLQRLSWSGLSEKDFELVTSMENMHFCKPKKEYYLEIADKIKCSPERCLMAGNDTLEDLSASKAGMATFLVEDYILHRGGDEPACDYRGSLQGLVKLIEELR
ncbi:MAG: HAD family hydrolase [Bacillota bacterium]